MKQLFISSFLLLSIFSCSNPEKANTAIDSVATDNLSTNTVILTDTQIKSLNVQLGHVEKKQMGSTVKASGMLDVPPQNLVTISAPLGGFVKHTELLQGMKIQKGQLLVVMEHPDYIQMQQDYLDSKSQLEFLVVEYKRQQELAAENVNAAKTLQQSKSNYLSTKAKVEGLQAKLKLININPADIESGNIKSTISIYSPIAGYVSQVHINIGMHVNPTDVMVKIVDTDHLHAEAQVFEKDISKLAVGQNVRITLSNETKERLAKVYLIGKEITPERTVRVHCHLSQEDPTLIPGMYFTAIIETEENLANVLPNEALVNYEGKDFVFVADPTNPHRYEMVEISKGLSNNNFTVVEISDSMASSSIVIKGSYELLGLLKNKEE